MSRWHAKRVLMWRRFPWIWKLFAAVSVVNIAGMAADLVFRPIDHVALASNVFGLVVFASMAGVALRAVRNANPLH